MFRLFEVVANGIVEVLPTDETYNVKELGDYEFQFLGKTFGKLEEDVFIEDLPLDRNLYVSKFDSLHSVKPSKLFQDYFGSASFSIRGNVYKINIQIEKFKIAEIEEILLFLWTNDNKIFDNFFSKSSIKSSVGKEGDSYNLTSKFVLFCRTFLELFDSLFTAFDKSARFKLAKETKIVNYTPSAVSERSLAWLLQNLDEVQFDGAHKNHPDSIPIGSDYGYIGHIASDITFFSKNTYENATILGAFKYMILTLNTLKSSIQNTVSVQKEFGSKEYADFRDLRKVPYLKLLRDSLELEMRLKSLYTKYKFIFPDTIAKIGRPKITNVFFHLAHYRQAYRVIANLYDYKLRLDGAFNLLNVRKLSQLYEVYNLHQIVHGFTSKLNMSMFGVEFTSSREDGITNLVSFSYREFSVNIYYEMQYPNAISDQIRIDKRFGSYYKPDYIIQISSSSMSLSYVMDSKYSRYQTVKYKYLPDSIFKYILNTGFTNDRYRKVDGLVLIFPGEQDELIVYGQNYSPQIRLISSKPKFNEGLRSLISDIVDHVFPATLRR
ncbi:hypothetical protein [Dyadobacter crusticola]|uniref:hypothetical protein n=1 Tax=Dyadobacter crusticola TaxID=292407 RepID=UPI0004E1D5C2|nr:hypothetical protein [Dyadobacter crusticola]